MIVLVPRNRLRNSLFKRNAWRPTERSCDLGVVDCVSAVVPRSILHIANQVFLRAECMDDQAYDVQVCALIVAADIVDFARQTARENRVERAAMVVHIQPVANLHPVAVHRQRYSFHAVVNHERNELFRKLVRAIVIRAPRDVQRQSERLIIRAADEICARFCRGIRTVWRERRRFREQPVTAQRAVDLIRRNL